MSEQTSFEVRLYSPRWGHEDIYNIALDRGQMSVRVGANTAVCSWVEAGDPEWSGYHERVDNPLERVLANDHIYPPTVFIDALEQAWTAWRDGTLNDEEVRQEVEELCEWVNEVSRSKPTSEFWRNKF